MSATESSMVSMVLTRFIPTFTLWLVLAAASCSYVSIGYAWDPNAESESSLVRITITTEIHGVRDGLAINERLSDDYNPTVIQQFSSTGIALGRRGYIMTFLGYGRVFIQKTDSHFEVNTHSGQRYKGNLIGIDQGNGVAVIHVPDGNFKVTPVCQGCTIGDGTTVIAPVFMGPGGTQFQKTQILSMHSNQGVQELENWVLRTNRPFLGIGEPIFANDGRVLGFVVGQDVTGLRNVVYPVSALLSSAENIIANGDDIRTGWLGVNTDDTPAPTGYGVLVHGVDEGSPAQKAGLVSSDIVLSYNDRKIDNVRQFIHFVQDTPIGSSAELGILRQGRPMKLSAVIQSRKFPNRLELLTSNLQTAFGPIGGMMRSGSMDVLYNFPFGFDVINLTPNLAAKRQVKYEKGILVVNIAEKTPADLAGIKTGDIILSVNKQPVADARKFTSFLRTLPSGSTVSMTVLREDSEQTISVQLSNED